LLKLHRASRCSSNNMITKNSISVCRRNVYWAKISSAFVMLEEVPKDMQNGFESKQWARARMTCVQPAGIKHQNHNAWQVADRQGE